MTSKILGSHSAIEESFWPAFNVHHDMLLVRRRPPSRVCVSASRVPAAAMPECGNAARRKALAPLLLLCSRKDVAVLPRFLPPRPRQGHRVSRSYTHTPARSTPARHQHHRGLANEHIPPRLHRSDQGVRLRLTRCPRRGLGGGNRGNGDKRPNRYAIKASGWTVFGIWPSNGAGPEHQHEEAASCLADTQIEKTRFEQVIILKGRAI